jgi:hypothetical protein
MFVGHGAFAATRRRLPQVPFPKMSSTDIQICQSTLRVGARPLPPPPFLLLRPEGQAAGCNKPVCWPDEPLVGPSPQQSCQALRALLPLARQAPVRHGPRCQARPAAASRSRTGTGAPVCPFTASARATLARTPPGFPAPPTGRRQSSSRSASSRRAASPCRCLAHSRRLVSLCPIPADEERGGIGRKNGTGAAVASQAAPYRLEFCSSFVVSFELIEQKRSGTKSNPMDFQCPLSLATAVVDRPKS